MKLDELMNIFDEVFDATNSPHWRPMCIIHHVPVLRKGEYKRAILTYEYNTRALGVSYRVRLINGENINECWSTDYSIAPKSLFYILYSVLTKESASGIVETIRSRSKILEHFALDRYEDNIKNDTLHSPMFTEYQTHTNIALVNNKKEVVLQKLIYIEIDVIDTSEKAYKATKLKNGMYSKLYVRRSFLSLELLSCQRLLNTKGHTVTTSNGDFSPDSIHYIQQSSIYKSSDIINLLKAYNYKK